MHPTDIDGGATQPDRHGAIAPITMRVPQACRYLGIGRSTLYVLIGKGEVEAIKLGSATLVLTASLDKLVESRRGSLCKPSEAACH